MLTFRRAFIRVICVQELANGVTGQRGQNFITILPEADAPSSPPGRSPVIGTKKDPLPEATERVGETGKR